MVHYMHVRWMCLSLGIHDLYNIHLHHVYKLKGDLYKNAFDVLVSLMVFGTYSSMHSLVALLVTCHSPSRPSFSPRLSLWRSILF